MPEVPKGYVENLPLNYKHLRNIRKFENVPDGIVKQVRNSYYARVEGRYQKVDELLKVIKVCVFLR